MIARTILIFFQCDKIQFFSNESLQESTIFLYVLKTKQKVKISEKWFATELPQKARLLISRRVCLVQVRGRIGDFRFFCSSNEEIPLRRQGVYRCLLGFIIHPRSLASSSSSPSTFSYFSSYFRGFLMAEVTWPFRSIVFVVLFILFTTPSCFPLVLFVPPFSPFASVLASPFPLALSRLRLRADDPLTTLRYDLANLNAFTPLHHQVAPGYGVLPRLLLSASIPHVPFSLRHSSLQLLQIPTSLCDPKR